MCGLGKPNATNRSRADVVPVPPNQGVPGRAASGPKLTLALTAARVWLEPGAGIRNALI